MQLLPGVRSVVVPTDRLEVHLVESGPEDGIPVVMVHGNLSTGRFFEHLFPGGPEGYRIVAPDMRGFGDTERLPLDATRGLADWADDVAALLRTLGIERPVHLLGWSTAGAAIVDFASEHAVASLTFLDPVSPYGFGGVHADGTPCFPDWAGSGGGIVNPEVVRRIAEGDDSTESPFSIRSVMRTAYWLESHTEPREDLFVAEVLKTVTGADNYPGDATPSPNWPGTAPGTTGIINALSPKYCNWTRVVDLDPKPPVLWTHGAEDSVVSDTSMQDLGTLGELGYVPGWPGADVFGSQPMVSQIREVLGRYAAAGGRVRTEIVPGAGHSPHLEQQQLWESVFWEFIGTAERGATTTIG